MNKYVRFDVTAERGYGGSNVQLYLISYEDAKIVFSAYRRAVLLPEREAEFVQNIVRHWKRAKHSFYIRDNNGVEIHIEKFTEHTIDDSILKPKLSMFECM